MVSLRNKLGKNFKALYKFELQSQDDSEIVIVATSLEKNTDLFKSFVLKKHIKKMDEQSETSYSTQVSLLGNSQ